MTRIVTITQPTDAVRCGPDGLAVFVFTVTNISGTSLRVGAQALGDAPTQTSWLTIEGPSERDLGANASDQVTVRAQIPSDTPPGNYTFRLLVFSVKRPGEDYTEGETVAIEVLPTAKPAPAPAKKFPWWIPLALAAVLLIGGVITWLVWPKDIEELQAAFTADGSSGIAPFTVAFDDQSKGNPTGWKWDFGDGGTSTEQNPTHIYDQAGSYDVSLKVTRETDVSTTEQANFVMVKEPADVPKGLVAFFSGTSCPIGWRVAEYAQGRLIVAIDEGGAVKKQVGKEPLKDQEDPKHAHPYTGTVNLGGKSILAASGGGNDSATSRGSHSFKGMTKEASTGLPFIQYVICEKQ